MNNDIRVLMPSFKQALFYTKQIQRDNSESCNKKGPSKTHPTKTVIVTIDYDTIKTNNQVRPNI